MSWIFGLNKGQGGPADFSQLGLPPPPGDSGGNDGDKKGSQGQSEAYRFDSAALERAAKAAKELEKSRMW